MIDRRQFLGSAAAALALTKPVGALAFAEGLDLALVNAELWLGAAGSRSASAIGIAGDRIAVIGADAVRRRTTRRTRVIDLDGAFVMPAFIDNHTHFLMGSNTLSQPVLLDAKGPADFAERIGAVARASPGKWIRGGHWDDQRLGGLPTKEWLDTATPDTPVALPRTDQHMYLLNSVALRLAGITRDTLDPPGGVILRDAKGEPTGIVKDNAMFALVERAIPPASEADNDAAIRAGIRHAWSKGVAQAHVTDIWWDGYRSVRRIHAAGDIGLRFYNFVPIADWEKMAAIVAAEGRGDDWVRWGGVKALSDGSLGSRTALFKRDYTDAPGTHGVRTISKEDLTRWIPAADKAGLHVAAHAIGDLAIDDVLDIMAATAKANGARDRRFRIEHAQHISPGSIPRFAKQDVIASVQPYHAIDDGRWAVKRIGQQRLRGTYAFHALMASGARVTFGSDWPVAPLDPLLGVYAAVTRETIDGANPNGWMPDEKVSVENALLAYTAANAHAGFQEDRLGRLAPGFLADITVLDADPRKIAPDEIAGIKVLRTIVGGHERFTA